MNEDEEFFGAWAAESVHSLRGREDGLRGSGSSPPVVGLCECPDEGLLVQALAEGDDELGVLGEDDDLEAGGLPGR